MTTIVIDESDPEPDSPEHDDIEMVVILEDDHVPDHFAELFSPPRVCFAAKQLGLRAHLSMDILNGFDFVTSAGRGAAWRLLERHQPDFIMLSPPCTMFSQLQHCFRNFERMDPEEVSTRMREARCMLLFTVQVAKYQCRRHKFFCVEHPHRATSWQEECFVDLMSETGCFTVDFDQCRTGLQCPNSNKPLKKRTRLLSNAPAIRQVFAPLQCNCHQAHQRVAGHVDGVKLSAYAQRYTAGLCQKIAEAVKLTVVS